MSQPLLLTFFLDGPRWHNAVRAMAYPRGYSYVQPFRYRDERVDPALLDALKRSPASLHSRDAYLAARFRDPAYSSRCIALRRVSVTQIDSSEDDYRVYFSSARSLTSELSTR
jgi:hypothetical protein